MAKSPKSATPVLATKHKDKRANIPTEELRDFVADDEKAPKKILYPRDPSLDPQLVWQGKDEQDRQPLEVPAVPIYIQEKIKPQVIIENLRETARAGEQQQPLELFGDFNGIKFEQLIEFYQHKDGVKWANRMILGDSLLVMNSLAEKEGLKGQVQMIYLDPPYGIKFGSNWQVSTRKRDVKDGKAEDATRQPEQIRAFRDTWKLGIHSYLAYLRDRLTVARELLTESGSVFVQIGDENVHLVRNLLDETFGSDNFISLITVRKTGGTTGTYLQGTADYILWFGKDVERTKYRSMLRLKDSESSEASSYDLLELSDGMRRRMTEEERELAPDKLVGKRFQLTILTSPRIREARTGYYPIQYEGVEYLPSAGEWKTHREGIERLRISNRIGRAGSTIRYVRYLEDFPATVLTNTWTDLGGASDPVYVVQTNAEIVKRCLLMATDPGDLVLDPTCGSGTTAYVAEQWGRRWITCDTSRVAVALARTRLMAGRFPYYLLGDSPEGLKKESELSGKLPPDIKTGGDIKRGFVYERVPHVTLKAIANNEEIDSIDAEFAPKIEKALAALNKAAKKTWQEWEVPRNLTGDSTDDTDKKASAKSASYAVHSEFWQLRHERQKAIDAAIARHADTELLYDQPYEDNKRIRVTGPFTVESLSPHRFLSADENGDGTVSEQEARQHHDFTTMILDNLRKAGIQNTHKEERLKFDRLDSFAGTWLHATGDYTDKDGKSRRAAVCIGPEHGTVGPDLVKEAAKEAVQGVGFDLLIVCGFAFDPHVSEEVKRYGKLAVVPARMNPDLAMGDELLKKTGAGNLFMVFGEPDVEIKKQKNGQLTVEIKGVDIYDPTTGQIRNSSTDDIACWFIDTEYNGESFFVRHAYFTGADEPYEKLKRALRADIDEAAWSSLYSTVSRPFDKPKSSKIAIKVINHYGDEVLKVYEA